MKVVEVIAGILKKENVEFLACYPLTPVIEAAAAAGIRPIVCRQERVGVGIADGFSRVSNGKKIGVFAMQLGPGAENAFAGVATAYSDSSPILVLPSGHARGRSQVFPLFNSSRSFETVTKSVETLNIPEQVIETMRRALGQLKVGRLGPVMVELPADVLEAQVDDGLVTKYVPTGEARSGGNPDDVKRAVKVVIDARDPIILAGQGVLYAEASDELMELAQVLQAPVMTTIDGKSAFPENHPLSLGASSVTTTGPVVEFLKKADVVLAVGTSLTKHPMNVRIPEGKKIIHITNDGRDLQKDYRSDHPILGDAKLVLRQVIEMVRPMSVVARREDDSVRREISRAKEDWLREWMPVLTSREVPITPYRIIQEFMQVVDPGSAIVTHDSGRPRDQLVPFYRTTVSRGYLGWGKSHSLGTGLGLIMGAKLAAPQKICVNFMGDAAFGMTGLDFETAVRCGIPITTIVMNNSTMATEKEDMKVSHELYGTRTMHGNYSEMGRAMGGVAERVEEPEEISPAIKRAMKHNAEGKAVLLEFMTSEETRMSHYLPF